jgi:hypothetical protein
MVPGYNYLVGYKDLYPVMGGERDFFELGRGIYFFTVELMTSYKLFNQKQKNNNRWENDEFNEFDKYLLFGDAYVDWKPFDHPQFGAIEIGGAKKNYIRNHVGFMLEEDIHRNMAFAIYNAYQTPKLEIIDVKIEPIDNNLNTITATIFNTRIMPTHSDFDSRNKINAPNYITLNHPNIISGLIVENKDLNLINEQKNATNTIEISKIGGMDKITVQWIVSGTVSKSTINVNSVKGGTVQYTINP